MSSSLAEDLGRAAAEAPDRVFLRTHEGDVTYAAMADLVSGYQRALRRLGVQAGDTVALMMANSATQVAVWFALNALRAIHAPLNTALPDESLRSAVRVAEATLVVADVEHLAKARRVVHDRAVAVGSLQSPPGPITDDDRLAAGDSDDLEVATLLFTSGTTGRSKACALSHRYLLRQGQLHAKYLGLTGRDVLYCPFPLFHIDAATLTVSAALSVRATAALGERFSASRFWREVRDVGATVFNFMGATLTILWKQDPRPDDSDHSVRLAWGVPMPPWQAGFEKRFGVRLFQVYGSTDAGVCVYDPVDTPAKPGAAGRVIDEFEVTIAPFGPGSADHGAVGEILVRGREPGLTMNGYFGMPEATADTIVDGWVHTGDLGSLDSDGFLTFHGRLSDSIRRRGENISAREVEELVESHPHVLEAAAIGVPSELTEEDVMVFVVPRAGVDLSLSELHRHCLSHGARFMSPRYFALVPRLPKTPTEKVEKFRLKEQGIQAAQLDTHA